MKISVIVPVYNVENYLKACVDSILASTFTDFELILVDDGSTDSSGRICDEYASRDARVIVNHQGKKGISKARNSGIELSSSDLIAFVDADDVIAPSMLQQLLDALESCPDCDFSMGRASTFFDGSMPELDVESSEDATEVEYSQYQYMSYLFRGNQFGYPVVWCKLFRREFIGGERFKDIDAEDIEWLTRLCVNMKKSVVVERLLYGYRVRSNSITHENGGVNWATVRRLNTFLMCLNDMPKEYTKYRSWCLLYTYKMMLNIRNNARNTEYYPEVQERNSYIYSETIEELKHCELKWWVRTALYTFYHMPRLYAIVYIIYARLYEATHK
jgi:Glycosyltransferases involved in cell wall biogenesis